MLQNYCDMKWRSMINSQKKKKKKENVIEGYYAHLYIINKK